MKFIPTHTTLKNGALITIREAVKKDAAGLLLAMSRYLAESRHLLTEASEFRPTILQEKRWIQELADSRNSVLLVAVHNNKIIGSVDLKGEPRSKTRHNSTLGIGILKEWQGLGLGNALMQAVIHWARENLTIEYIWLHVFATNTIAIALYEKMGFEKRAVQEKFIKQIDGMYEDNVMMRLHVK